jgi:hypothetical protein
MSAPPPKAALSLADFPDLFEVLARVGTEQVVIGGCAVGAYGRLIGEPITSGDLDLYATRRNADTILTMLAAAGGRVIRRARPRSIPVAFVDWKGKELNVLTASEGLQSPEIEAELAREFVLPGSSLAVLVADPYELLANKLAVNRPKDRPHIAILRRFLEAEAVVAFRDETVPRKRIAPAARLLSVERQRTLSRALAERILPLCRLPSDFRFLADHVKERAFVRALLERAKGTEAESDVRQILGKM